MPKHPAEPAPERVPGYLEWSRDPVAWSIDDEYLLGDSLLVAPVLDDTDHRRLWLPPGRWTEHATGETHDGERWLDVDAPLEILPLFAREGSAILDTFE